MKYSLLMLCTVILGVFCTSGCGGKGAGSSFVIANLSIFWAERARTVGAPSSALSAVIRLESASESGEDIVFTVNRPEGADAALVSYASPTRARVGDMVVEVTFHAGLNGEGDVVGLASGLLHLRREGHFEGSVVFTGSITRVEIPTSQFVTVGETKALSASAIDTWGNLVVVSPNAINWSTVPNERHLSFENGLARGLLRGLGQAIATIDNIASAPTPIHVRGVARALILGSLPGAPLNADSSANGISLDGKVVVGVGIYAPGKVQAFRWTESSGMVGLGFLAGYVQSSAQATNEDGSVVVGWCEDGNGTQVAFRWTSATGMVSLGTLPGGTSSRASGVSADGNVVVGTSSSAFGQQGFIWTSATGMTALGDFLPNDPPYHSSATAVSSDGRVVVGQARYTVTGQGDPVSQACRWVVNGGIEALGWLYDSHPSSEAFCASYYGDVIGGVSIGRTGLAEPFRWSTTTGMVSLLIGGIGTPRGISSDGNLMVGPTDADPNTSFIWDPVNGTQSLPTYLNQLGIHLGNFAVLSANGVSGDGKSIAGEAVAVPVVQAFLIELP